MSLSVEGQTQLKTHLSTVVPELEVGVAGGLQKEYGGLKTVRATFGIPNDAQMYIWHCT